MSFLHPLMLCLLALGGLIWLLHARQRVAAQVSSLLIWERVRQHRASRQVTTWKPRLNWLMVLQVLVLAALAAALAQPLIGGNRDVDHWIYVLDNSASMQSGARDQALATIASRLDMPEPSARVSLISAGLSARPILAGQPAGTADLAARSAQIPPEDGGADWPGVLRLVSALSRSGDTTRVVILTDGETPALFAGRTDVETLTLPSTAPNAALAATLADRPEAGEMTAEGHIYFSRDLAQTTLTLDWRPTPGGAPETLVQQAVSASPDQAGRTAFAVSFPRPADGILSLRLSADGAASDNQVFFLVRAEPLAASIAFLGDPDHPLAAALDAVPGTELSYAPDTGNLGAYDLVVAMAQTPDAPVTTNLLSVAPGATDAQWLQTPIPISGWARNEPLAAAVNWPSLTLDRALALPARDGAQTLLASASHSLIDKRVGPYGLDLRMAFDPAASNWPQRSDFVVFLDRLVKSLVPSAGQTVDPVCNVGQPCAVPPNLAGGVLSRIDSADRQPRTVGETFIPHRAGLFSLTREDRSRLIAIHPPSSIDVAPPMTGETALADLSPRPVALWPWLLGLAAVLLLVEALLAHRRKRQPAAWLRANALRIAALGLVGLAIANPRLPILSTERATLIVQPLAAAPHPDAAGLDTIFYRDALTPAPESPTLPILVGDIDAAVELGLAMIPNGVPGSVIASGRSAASPSALGYALADRAIAIDAVTAPSPQAGDVWISDIVIPDSVFPQDRFLLHAVLGATTASTAELAVAADGETVHAQTIDLAAGGTAIAIPVTASKAGPMVLQATIAARADPEPGNDSMGAVVNIGPAGRVAILAGDAAAGANFARAMAQQGFAPEIIDPAAAPITAQGWSAYNALVLINLPAAALVTDQQRAIEAGVREQGLGLMIVGGANSFGPGGYLETPLDEVSPISSRVPRDKPGVALVFVLDRSSSMSQPVGPVTRLDIAKQATLAAARLLDDDSSVGVVTFDSRARLSLPLTSVSEMGFIERSIGQISLGGGTALQRGLSAGYDQIRRADAAARHIIVMTDGLSQPSNYAVLMRSITEDQITVSTVAIGEQAEHELLQSLAEQAGGMFHATTDFEALPSILSQEAMRLSGDAFETAHVQPEWIAERPPFLSELADNLPAIDGYVLATVKPEAQTLATLEDTTGQPVPFLAHWQYGVGHVMAITTDAFGGWTADWQDERDYPRLFSQTLRAFARPDGLGHRRLASHQEAPGLYLSLPDGADPAAFIATDEPGASLLPAATSAKGRADALLVPRAPGPLTLTLGAEGRQLGVYANYPLTLNPGATVDAGLALAARTGGRLIEPGQSLVRPISPYWTALAIWPILAGAALVLFLIELIHRYSGFALPWRASGAQSR